MTGRSRPACRAGWRCATAGSSVITMADGLRPVRLAAADVLRVGAAGLRARPLRVLLSALGIAIGIAAMLSVVGISASSRENLDRRLAALGTNLLTVGPGQSLFGEQSHLPD